MWNAHLVSAQSTAQNLPERASKLLVPDGVDDGIAERVGVAEPETDAREGARHVTGARRAERNDGGHDEERKPADEEAADDDTERTRRAAQALTVAARQK